jgi:DNA phosphorothioation system restriction enzyme
LVAGGADISLRNFELRYEYRSDKDNMVDDFYIPCLQQSTRYYRAVGYFTSYGLAIASKGLSEFIKKNGQMRLIASPLFEPEDIDAFKKGYKAREDIIEHALLRQISDEALANNSEITRYRLNCIAWLIADGKLDIKVACAKTEDVSGLRGIYHEKIGIFTDSEENSIAFTGSSNETMGGLVNNFESIDVYPSWDDQHGRVKRKINNFERLWSNLTYGLVVLDFPLAAKRRLLQFRLKLPPKEDPESKHNNKFIIPLENVGDRHFKIDIPQDLVLRKYQEQACEAWISNQGKGILAMATGSGKTITALSASIRLFKEIGKLFIVIACPFQHLVDQWDKEAKRFGFRPILAYQSKQEWENELNNRILDYNTNNRNVVLVITTHTTFISDTMQKTISKVKGPALVIGDEVHHLGATEGKKNLPEKILYRLGLSATPKRWFDEEGTDAIETYFGETVFEFSLKQAIEEGCLCRYYYYPMIVKLTDEELEKYNELTKKIAQLFDKKKTMPEDSYFKMLLLKRSEVLNRASNKLVTLVDLLSEKSSLHHALFYCVSQQIDEVMELLGNNLGIRAHRFTVEESTEERVRLLDDFTKGILQALVAIRCLDEGVDVPSTEEAYILASSSNPREFIQRRGRILRNHPGKKYARIYDMITVPSLSNNDVTQNQQVFNTERKILKKELQRFREFADIAENHFQATEVVWQIAKSYNLLDF